MGFIIILRVRTWRGPSLGARWHLSRTLLVNVAPSAWNFSGSEITKYVNLNYCVLCCGRFLKLNASHYRFKMDFIFTALAFGLFLWLNLLSGCIKNIIHDFIIPFVKFWFICLMLFITLIAAMLASTYSMEKQLFTEEKDF